MKKILLLLFTCCSAFAQPASGIMVVRVVGRVESPMLKREIRTGDTFQPKDQLKFATRESYIIISSAQTGRKKIGGVPDPAPREFLDLIASFVRPEYKSTAARGLSIQYLESLQNSLAYDTILILGDGIIPIQTDKLSLTPPAVVKASYTANKKMVHRKISAAKELNLAASLLFENGKVLPGKVVIEYYEDGNQDPVFSPGLLLGNFVPLYLDNEQNLVTELRSLVQTVSAPNTPYKEIQNYLGSEYAHVQQDNLKAWLKKNNLPVE